MRLFQFLGMQRWNRDIDWPDPYTVLSTTKHFVVPGLGRAFEPASGDQRERRESFWTFWSMAPQLGQQ